MMIVCVVFGEDGLSVVLGCCLVAFVDVFGRAW